MNRVSSTERYVYVKAKIPRERYESLVRLFRSEGLALQHLRLRWERVCADGPLDAAAQSSAASGLDRIL